ncbi:hypothetical protein [Alterisphingorhabdus coralli]|uniref:Uncharacterized protein n=1 Tax=Alterisphingorhabdus coralli TaxID=3071408 RepID=A0AA97F527_9SPHN|nr:hypothetical protein [Parasphingorhabdus sp. SCSIO 66989]WOE74161.1 hypothetical protein RB602_09870 [Parasphingorhabdus sp. SCSIO 66989]
MTITRSREGAEIAEGKPLTDNDAYEASNSTALQELREAIEIAWQQAERGEFADYSLEGSLAKLPIKTA